MNKIRLIVTCGFGLEAVVKRELLALGFPDTTGSDGRVEFDACPQDIPRLNLRLRAADRVLLKLGEFPAKDFGQLFDRTRQLAWETWIPVDARITVTGKCVRSRLASVRSCQSIVKKALVERMGERLGAGWLPETGEEFTVQVSILKDVAQLTLDTSGNGLHKRGYRAGAGEAPLRENLAAALVLLSFWDSGRVLLDPMCGSGTILIEAALIGRNIAPGLGREFAAEKWPALDPEDWRKARMDARAEILPAGTLKIFGSDIDEERVRDCRMNARRAGVEDDIVCERRDISQLEPPGPYGVVVTNPPYGINLGSPADLGPLYKAIDAVFRERQGWSVYVLTADKKFPDTFRRGKPDKVRKLFNGTIEVNYYQYFGERPPK
ncbi:MAG: class I SAM-dependent RNA methyltransferase [Candidatus Omnitrophica bacterium]|nr:class I SAM-dependent RNA methyltransferase [Candidatus Omnitrophota bacterium]